MRCLWSGWATPSSADEPAKGVSPGAIIRLSLRDGGADMRVMTVLGTRPEIVRLSLIIPKLDRLAEHRLVHTGQNFDPGLSDVFFKELAIRSPDAHLGVTGETPAEQIAGILQKVETVLRRDRPDRLLVLGDTNSALCALIGKRMGIPVYHIESGNRCFDDHVPEEVNRRVIDHSSDILMAYTERSRLNLLAEGIPSRRIFLTGNPIFEVMQHYAGDLEAVPPARLGLAKDGYFLVTIHRAENVDVESRLRAIAASMRETHIRFGLPVVVSLHPHTRKRLLALGIDLEAEGIHVHEPFGFLDFIALERHAKCVLTDSGTVQEEAAILGRPSVTLRDTTERPETVECGSNILSGVEPDSVVRAVQVALANGGKWEPPREYLTPNVSDIVVGIVLGGGSP